MSATDPLRRRRSGQGLERRRAHYKNTGRMSSVVQRRVRAVLLRAEQRAATADRRRQDVSPLLELADTVVLSLALDDDDGGGVACCDNDQWAERVAAAFQSLDEWRALAQHEMPVTLFATVATLWSASGAQDVVFFSGDAMRAALLALLADEGVALGRRLVAALQAANPLHIRTEALWLLVSLGGFGQLRGSPDARPELLQQVNAFSEWLAPVVTAAAAAGLDTVPADAGAEAVTDYVDALASAIPRVWWVTQDDPSCGRGFSVLLRALHILGDMLFSQVAAAGAGPALAADDVRHAAVARASESLALAVAFGAAPLDALALPLRVTQHYGRLFYNMYLAGGGVALDQPGADAVAAHLSTCAAGLARALGDDARFHAFSRRDGAADLAVPLLRALGLSLTETWLLQSASQMEHVLTLMCRLVRLCQSRLPDDEQVVEALTVAGRRTLALGLQRAEKLDHAIRACYDAGASIPNVMRALAVLRHKAETHGRQ